MKLQQTNIPKFRRSRTALAAIAMVAAAATTLVTAPASAQSHDHGSATHGKLSLNHGHKWATDDALRSGMSRIRELVGPQVAAAHAGKLTRAQYAGLASKIETEIGSIVANCKLEPEADAMLHLVIADLLEGVEAMAGKNDRLRPAKGLEKAALAVNGYGRHFDHPGFKPIRDIH